MATTFSTHLYAHMHIHIHTYTQSKKQGANYPRVLLKMLKPDKKDKKERTPEHSTSKAKGKDTSFPTESPTRKTNESLMRKEQPILKENASSKSCPSSGPEVHVCPPMFINMRECPHPHNIIPSELNINVEEPSDRSTNSYKHFNLGQDSVHKHRYSSHSLLFQRPINSDGYINVDSELAIQLPTRCREAPLKAEQMSLPIDQSDYDYPDLCQHGFLAHTLPMRRKTTNSLSQPGTISKQWGSDGYPHIQQPSIPTWSKSDGNERRDCLGLDNVPTSSAFIIDDSYINWETIRDQYQQLHQQKVLSPRRDQVGPHPGCAVALPPRNIPCKPQH